MSSIVSPPKTRSREWHVKLPNPTATYSGTMWRSSAAHGGSEAPPDALERLLARRTEAGRGAAAQDGADGECAALSLGRHIACSMEACLPARTAAPPEHSLL